MIVLLFVHVFVWLLVALVGPGDRQYEACLGLTRAVEVAGEVCEPLMPRGVG
jgi:hypothetical protein